MADRKPATKATQKSVKRTDAAATGFTAEEKSAMRQRVKELKAAGDKEELEAALVAKIAEMKGTDRILAKKIHAIVKATAPDLSPKLWYGMPAYYKEGRVICHFQDAEKFKARYATLGFMDGAKLDDGTMWPVAFALKDLTAADEAKIRALVKKAVS